MGTADDKENKGDNEIPKDSASAAVDQCAQLLSGHGVNIDGSCAVAVGILCQEAVQAAGLTLFNNVHNQQLGQMAEQAAAMKGIIELHRSGGAPHCKHGHRPCNESDAGGSDQVLKVLDVLLAFLGNSSDDPGRPSDVPGVTNGNGQA